MRKKRLLFLWLALLFLAKQGLAQEDGIMYAHYINVGQAAAVLLEFPCGAVLIDAGAQDDNYHKALIDYLGHFFQRRKDLDSTLALVMVTHPHIDHNEALYDVGQKFRIDRYIDDGLRVGSGSPNQKYMQDNAATADIQYRSYSFEEITKGGNKDGLTDSVIDPVDCPNGDPQIILYSGRFDRQPDDWSKTDFNNYNNHSLVVKVVFGKASFLFTGDLETAGLRTLVDEYGSSKALDVDVLMVGHHGAANATTDDYLNVTTPEYAVISCGPWDFGKGEKSPFTTFAYGHPRVGTIEMLENYVTALRKTPIEEEAADGARKFRPIDIAKCIYATPWDQTIVIRASLEGNYSIKTEN
ncbi:MAG TPA: hypothetical protein VHE34_09445 [Puia sp.]|uniref:ComEC/Rec2 family competence protein n=1 Tax=Puia sp. TaxID=2045100 RepID=UPI002BD2402C|nr:hypothetical protein [Puia sp.]HVU95438.1 hypothetical protein [Puia sp.]